MSDLFEQVLHHIEGSETVIQNWQTPDGIKTVELCAFGPDRWIESVHENGRLMAIDCLAMILFTVAKSFNREHERRIVEAWAIELHKAVAAGEIQARDPVTLLTLETLPDGWGWLLSMADADKFIASRGMEWRFSEVASHLFNEFKESIEKRRFPPWMWEAEQTVTPAPVVQATETQEKRQDRRLKACIDAGLPMNEKAASLRLPYGVANIAKSEGVTRQAFSTDVKAALKRRDSAKREGVTVHRT